MEKTIKLTDSQYNAFKQHEPNLYNAIYFNIPPVFRSRDERAWAEAELYGIYLELTGLTLNPDCAMCEADNWKSLARLYFGEKKRRAVLKPSARNKIKKGGKTNAKK